MRVLIIGSTSIIGRAIAKHLRAIADVSFAGRKSADIEFDVTRFPPLTKVHSFDVVIHVAADFGGNSDAAISQAVHVNTLGTLNACRVASLAKAKHLILLSSLSATYQPDNPYYGIYGISKRQGEELAVFFCHSRNIPLTILRPTQIYDTEGVCRKHQNLFFSIIDRAAQGKDILLYGNNDARRNYLHMDDLAKVVLRVIETRCEGQFICAYPQSIRLSEIADLVFSIFQKGGCYKFDPEKPNIPDLPTITDFLIYDLIDFVPQIDLHTGITFIKSFRGEQV